MVKARQPFGKRRVSSPPFLAGTPAPTLTMAAAPTVMGTTRSRTDRFMKYRRAAQGLSAGRVGGGGIGAVGTEQDR
jgi:hypothetical protein